MNDEFGGVGLDGRSGGLGAEDVCKVTADLQGGDCGVIRGACELVTATNDSYPSTVALVGYGLKRGEQGLEPSKQLPGLHGYFRIYNITNSI